MPVGTIKSRVSRGREALRKALHGRERSWHQRELGDRRKRATDRRSFRAFAADAKPAMSSTL